jgi:methionine synthase I (cobalamin-dependent)
VLHLDGGLATTLQDAGLPVGSPVEPWVDERPERVAQAHAAFVQAGAEVVLTATFRTHPLRQPDWVRRCRQAALLARKSGAKVFGNIGPTGDLSGVERGAGQVGVKTREMVEHLAPYVDGFAVETCVRAEEAQALLDAVLEGAGSLPVALSLVPGPDGRLLDGTEPGPVLEALFRQGARWVGFNCGSAPEEVERAMDRVDPGLPLWAKPAGGPDAAAVIMRLVGRCDAVGGCCGVDPATLARGFGR